MFYGVLTDVPLPRVNDIVREKRSISPEMAVLLSAYFGTSDGYWINLQAHFDQKIPLIQLFSHIEEDPKLTRDANQLILL